LKKAKAKSGEKRSIDSYYQVVNYIYWQNNTCFMTNGSNQKSSLLAWGKAVYTNSPLHMYNRISVDGVIVDISDERFTRYAAPEIPVFDGNGFRQYVNRLKLTEACHFKEKGESFAIVFLNDVFKNLPKVELENRRPIVDYRSVLQELGFHENYVQLNDTRRPNETILTKAFVYIPERAKTKR
jgi:hypothetical protein